MSVYAAKNGSAGEQVASNKGWGDFIRWVESLSGPYTELQQLAEEGFTEETSMVREQLVKALQASVPEGSVHSTAVVLLDVLSDCTEDTVLTII